MGKMKARHVVLASDSCFSGDILNPNRSAAPEINDEYFRNAYDRVSRQVLTSGASEVVPDDSSFSRQLKLALEGNNRAYLDPLMLFSQLRLGVKGTTPLFGSLKDSGHQDGGSFLFFLKDGGTAVAASYGSSTTRDAELMVRVTRGSGADVSGAEVYIDGVLVGKASCLAQKLPSGKPVVVEVRFGNEAGKTELTLKSKELKEVAVPLTRMKGNLKGF